MHLCFLLGYGVGVGGRVLLLFQLTSHKSVNMLSPSSPPSLLQEPQFHCLVSLLTVFFKTNSFLLEQDSEVMGFTRVVLAHMILDSLIETMGQSIICMGDSK